MDLLQSQLPKLSDLVSDQVMAEIEASGRSRTYAPGQLVHHRGDLSTSFSIIKSGRVNGSNAGLDGTTLTTTILEAGDCYGEFTLFAGLPRTHDVWALKETVINSLSKKKFIGLTTRYPVILEALLTISLRRSYALLEFMDNLRRLPLEVRLAKLLLAQVRRKQKERSPKNREEETVIKSRQEELAFTLGVTRASVNKVLSALEKAELLKRGYGEVRIIDVEHLSHWVEERDLVTPLTVQT